MIALFAFLPLMLSPQDPQTPPSPPVTELSEGVVVGAREGRVTLECRVGSGGRLRNCRVISEDPPGAGFGPAALAAARQTRVSAPPPGGDGRIRWTMRSTLPAEAPSPANP